MARFARLEAMVSARSVPVDPAGAMSALRSAVGLMSLVSPELAARVLGLGSLNGDQGATVITRLCGVRELVLAIAVQHPSREVRRAALQAGLAVDSIDVVSTVVALRNGAPKAIRLTFAGGAALFVALGIAALASDE